MLALAVAARPQEGVTWTKGGKESKLTVRHAIVLPPQVELYRSTASEVESLPGASEEVAGTLSNVVTETLREKEVEAIGIESEMTPSAELASSVTQILEKFIGIIRGGPIPSEYRAARFGPIPKTLLPAPADVLVLVHARAFFPTRGSKIRGALGSQGGLPGPADVLVISIALADSRDGSVLYYCQAQAKKGFLNNSDPLYAAVRRCLRDLNQVSPDHAPSNK